MPLCVLVQRGALLPEVWLPLRSGPPPPSWPGDPVPYLPLGHGTHGTGHGSEHQARPTLAGLAEERPSKAQRPFVTA